MHAGADTAPPPLLDHPPTLRQAGAGEARAARLAARCALDLGSACTSLQGVLTIAAGLSLHRAATPTRPCADAGRWGCCACSACASSTAARRSRRAACWSPTTSPGWTSSSSTPLAPSAFVSKAEVRTWPVIGWLAAKNDTIFLRRGSRGHARIINEETAAAARRRLQRGDLPRGHDHRRRHPAALPRRAAAAGDRLRPSGADPRAAVPHAGRPLQPRARLRRRRSAWSSASPTSSPRRARSRASRWPRRSPPPTAPTGAPWPRARAARSPAPSAPQRLDAQA